MSPLFWYLVGINTLSSVIITHLCRTYHTLNFAHEHVGIIYNVYNTGMLRLFCKKMKGNK